MPKRSSRLWAELEKHVIRHTVAFRLKHEAGSPEEISFLKDALVLEAIPSVRNFEQLRQTSPKNDFTLGFSMEFEDQAGYNAYNVHPDHVAFVRARWIPEVESFLEIDYTNL
jgi:hypothetical protein